ncbi:hypothetical protein [Actinokineospora enzanensis]|uniref:hypothetical protein n=1 Tax=Actinokineospora enzanensis TaxID=155975 RepID=UPI0012EBC22A|nr:hypothetical protein [Actinokineospora enzanensis]
MPTTEQILARMRARRAGVPADHRTARILVLDHARLLSYLKPSDEWVDVHCEPLDDPSQDRAHALVAAGALPDFEQHVT